MERLVIALLLLLAGALPEAAATLGAQPMTTCEPALLATQVSSFCAPDVPTARCCEPVVAAVDLGGGVVPSCLCRVAAEAQLVVSGLNATHLLILYTSCGGLLRPGGAHLAGACEGVLTVVNNSNALPASTGGGGSSSVKLDGEDFGQSWRLPPRVTVGITIGLMVVCVVATVAACLYCARGVRRWFKGEATARRVHPVDDGE